MKTKNEVQDAINYSEINKFNIWSNPNKKELDSTTGDECEYCGKKCGKNPLYVHITVDGTILPNDIKEDDLKVLGIESQGCFPIGSGCAKKLFKSEIEKYTS